MKKLFVIIGLTTMTLLMSCAASVRTPKAGAEIRVGSIQPFNPDFLKPVRI